jgi:hypothetical protein
VPGSLGKDVFFDPVKRAEALAALKRLREESVPTTVMDRNGRVQSVRAGGTVASGTNSRNYSVYRR